MTALLTHFVLSLRWRRNMPAEWNTKSMLGTKPLRLNSTVREIRVDPYSHGGHLTVGSRLRLFLYLS